MLPHIRLKRPLGIHRNIQKVIMISQNLHTMILQSHLNTLRMKKHHPKIRHTIIQVTKMMEHMVNHHQYTTNLVDMKLHLKFVTITQLTKNYKPSRPAPLYDEYEQPRYPPLPVNLKDSSEKYSEYEKSVEKPFKNKKHEKSPESSYSSSYDPATYKSPYSYDTSNKHYPLPNEPGSQKNQYSGSSSKEVDYQPEVQTKTYSKPYYGSDDEVNYHGDNSYETGPKSQVVMNHLRSSEEYPPSKSSDNTEKKFRYYTENDKPESSHNTYLAEPERPKRVEGVVYRSRKTYPDLQSPRSQKSYLPYKLYNPRTAPAVDYKVYENAPDKNLSESPRKKTIKLKYKPLKKDSYQEHKRHVGL
ncbi:chitin-binding type-2 domain-containing protein [Caerostris extrusa]|uniref:Chitin-binding type-2 domain-containing protein n=1 Tax=Caerostris extrusa TaxID=172846 RepID=A0AAV4N1L0_CAEEX|nr:chitin-binding type-2 domain-containing protein [Caerostris extrusa]